MAVVSPCVKSCRLVERTGVCRGCGRTLAEITAWRDATDADKRAILARLPARLARMADEEEPA